MGVIIKNLHPMREQGRFSYIHCCSRGHDCAVTDISIAANADFPACFSAQNASDCRRAINPDATGVSKVDQTRLRRKAHFTCDFSPSIETGPQRYQVANHLRICSRTGCFDQRARIIFACYTLEHKTVGKGMVAY